MNKLQKGFSLIELMIVVAIIGVLAAIAVPQYNNYIARGQVSEAMVLLAAVKTAIEEEAVSRNTFAADPTDATMFAGTDTMCTVGSMNSLNAAYGVAESGKYVECVYTVMGVHGTAGTGPMGDVVARFRSTGVNADLAGETILFRRDSEGMWTCDGMDSTVDAALQPDTCE